MRREFIALSRRSALFPSGMLTERPFLAVTFGLLGLLAGAMLAANLLEIDWAAYVALGLLLLLLILGWPGGWLTGLGGS